MAKSKPIIPLPDMTAVPETFLLCRDPGTGHVWNRIGYFRGLGGVITRVQQCSRCTVKKTERLTSRGARVGNNRYEYPENYLSAKGSPRILPSDVRKELLNRVIVFDNEDAMLAATIPFGR